MTERGTFLWGRAALTMVLALVVVVAVLFAVFRKAGIRAGGKEPAVVKPAPEKSVTGGTQLPENMAPDSTRTSTIFLPAGPSTNSPAPVVNGPATAMKPVGLKLPPTSPPGRIANEAILTFADGKALADFLGGPAHPGIRVVDMIRDWNMVRVRGDSEDTLRRFLDSVPGVLEKAPNILVTVPNESPQVSLSQRAEYLAFGSSALPWLGVRKEHAAWGKGVTVAVLDVGVGRVPGLNEQNIERIDLTSETAASSTPQFNGHATAVASIIAGSSPDMQGISPASRLLSIKVLNEDGTGDAFTLAKGIMEAADRPVGVINICIGSPSDTPVLQRAVEYALGKGCAVVAAAGNEGDLGVTYPARYPGVIAVSAVDVSGQPLPFSGKGPEVDVAAPGLGVRSLWSENTAVDFTGTSAAVPFVSGALAAVLSESSSLSPRAATDLLLRYTDDVGKPGKDSEFGCGILDVGRVMNHDTKGIFDIAVSDHYVADFPASASTVPLTVSVQNRGTEPVAKADLTIKAGAQEYEMTIADLGVGETIGYEIDVPRSAIAASTGLNVDSLVLLRGAVDVVPGNNFKRSTLFLRSNSSSP